MKQGMAAVMLGLLQRDFWLVRHYAEIFVDAAFIPALIKIAGESDSAEAKQADRVLRAITFAELGEGESWAEWRREHETNDRAAWAAECRERLDALVAQGEFKRAGDSIWIDCCWNDALGVELAASYVSVPELRNTVLSSMKASMHPVIRREIERVVREITTEAENDAELQERLKYLGLIPLDWQESLRHINYYEMRSGRP